MRIKYILLKIQLESISTVLQVNHFLQRQINFDCCIGTIQQVIKSLNVHKSTFSIVLAQKNN